MSEAGSYNAATYLLDRNIDAGRADKIAFTDGVRDLTYGALPTRATGSQICCAASASAAKSASP